MKNLVVFLFLFLVINLNAQESIKIGLVFDHTRATGVLKNFEENVKAELNQLLQYRFDLSFKSYDGQDDQSIMLTNISQAYQDNDVVVSLGFLSSQLFIQEQQFEKPTILAVITDPKLAELPKTDNGTSGVSNLVYIESPFNIARDLSTLYDVKAFKELAVVYETDFGEEGRALLENLVRINLEASEINTSLYLMDDILSGQTTFAESTDAVYVFPASGKPDDEIKRIFDAINAQKLPSVSLLGEDYISFGAFMGYETAQNFSLIPRRIALNTLKILEGKDAGSIGVEIDTYNENLYLNMAAARKIGVYPDFEMIARSTVLNLLEDDEDRKLSLQSAIAEALRNNLDIVVSRYDRDIQDNEIGIALADQLPQVDVSASLSVVDEITALSYQGAQGEINWLGSANVSQVIFSEPILANIAIQKILTKGAEYELQQTQLDIIVEVAESYLNILQAKTNLSIQQKNVEVTKENYNISKSKNALGYVGASDLYRWEAELANTNIQLNSAVATVKQAKFRLNQLLNRPIDEPFSVTNERLEDQLLLITDGRLDRINDYGQLDRYTSFLVDFSKDRLPSMKQLEANIAASERLRLSRERAFYLPSLAVSGSVNRVLGKSGVPEVFTELDNVTTWNVGVGLSYPIFQGNARRRQLDKSELQLQQLSATKQNVQNQLELRTRSNMENIYVAFTRMDLSAQAAVSANKNFQIVQDAYNQGQVNITALIDAQNSNLQTELNATNAVYTFILEFLNLERSIGFFYFLASEEERNQFFQASNEFLLKK
jgi:outer membrane protein TolC